MSSTSLGQNLIRRWADTIRRSQGPHRNRFLSREPPTANMHSSRGIDSLGMYILQILGQNSEEKTLQSGKSLRSRCSWKHHERAFRACEGVSELCPIKTVINHGKRASSIRIKNSSGSTAVNAEFLNVCLFACSFVRRRTFDTLFSCLLAFTRHNGSKLICAMCGLDTFPEFGQETRLIIPAWESIRNHPLRIADRFPNSVSLSVSLNWIQSKFMPRGPTGECETQ